MDLNNLNFDGLTPQEKAEALRILKDLANGDKSSYNELVYDDFDEIPVDIHTFLHEKKYLGNALYDAEGRFTLFPYWEKKLTEIFPTNTTVAYNTIILTGAIGLGKTLVSVVCLLYMLYRLLCLKDPYLYYGLQPIDKITISLMSITIENSKGVALDKMNQMLLSSEWFMAHGEMAGITNLEYRPNKHIELVAASSNNQIIGRALFCLDGDTEIVTKQGIYKIKDLVGKNINAVTIDLSKDQTFSELCTVQPTIKTNEIYEIELEDGTIIKCSPNHKFLLQDGSYKDAQELSENDELLDIKI